MKGWSAADVEKHFECRLVLLHLQFVGVRIFLRGGDRRLEISNARTVHEFVFWRLVVRPQLWRLLGRRQIVISIETISGWMLPFTLAFADGTAVFEGVVQGRMWAHLLAAVVFSLVGVAVLGICFYLMNKLSPFSIKKEIEEDQNVSLAVIMGAVIIGMAIIIAAAISG